MDDTGNNELDLSSSSDSEGSTETVEEVTVDYSQQLESIIQYQQTSIAMTCVLIGVLLSVSLIQIFKRYL